MEPLRQYSMRWNHQSSTIIGGLERLYRTGALTDVTLVCDGGSSVKCHKIVLVTCSYFFEHMFTEICKEKEPTTIVCLKDIKLSEIKAILDYMYTGEAILAIDEVAGFLRTAETLEVKGLNEGLLQRTATSSTTTLPSQMPSSLLVQPSSTASTPNNHHEAGSTCPPIFPLIYSIPAPFNPSNSPMHASPYNHNYGSVTPSSNLLDRRNAITFPIIPLWTGDKSQYIRPSQQGIAIKAGHIPKTNKQSIATSTSPTSLPSQRSSAFLLLPSSTSSAQSAPTNHCGAGSTCPLTFPFINSIPATFIPNDSTMHASPNNHNYDSATPSSNLLDRSNALPISFISVLKADKSQSIGQSQQGSTIKTGHIPKTNYQRIAPSPASLPSQKSSSFVLLPSSTSSQSAPTNHRGAGSTSAPPLRFPYANPIPATFIPNNSSMHASPHTYNYNNGRATPSSNIVVDRRNAFPFAIIPILTADKSQSIGQSQHQQGITIKTGHIPKTNINNQIAQSEEVMKEFNKNAFNAETKHLYNLPKVVGCPPPYTNSKLPPPPYFPTRGTLDDPVTIDDDEEPFAGMDSSDHSDHLIIDESSNSMESGRGNYSFQDTGLNETFCTPSGEVEEDNHLFDQYLYRKNGLPEGYNKKSKYKQYTMTTVDKAIEAIRGGMSATQAAEHFCIPARTLYDKVKKLGITTNRAYRKGCFLPSSYRGVEIEVGSTFSPEELGRKSKSDSDPTTSGSSSIQRESSPPDEKDYSTDSNETSADDRSENVCSIPPSMAGSYSENNEFEMGSASESD